MEKSQILTVLSWPSVRILRRVRSTSNAITCCLHSKNRVKGSSLECNDDTRGTNVDTKRNAIAIPKMNYKGECKFLIIQQQK